MLTVTEIQNSIAKILTENTKYKVYLPNVQENYEAPCFFISTALSGTATGASHNLLMNLEVSIAYYEKLAQTERIRNPIKNEAMVGRLFSLFSPNFQVKDRHLTTDNLEFSLTGEVGDVLVVTFDSRYYDDVNTDDSGDTPDIEKVDINCDVKTVFEG